MRRIWLWASALLCALSCAGCGEHQESTTARNPSTTISAPAEQVETPREPAAGSDAARACPFSATDPLVARADPPRLEPAELSALPTPHPCVPEGTALPTRLEPYDTVTLSRRGDSTSSVAVQLFVNDAGQVVAANVEWAEP